MAANQKVQTVTPNVDLAQIQNRSLSAARRHSGEGQWERLSLREISANARAVPGNFAQISGSQRFHVHLNRIPIDDDCLNWDSQRTLVGAVQRRPVCALFPGDMKHYPDLCRASGQRAFPITFRFSIGSLSAPGTRGRLLHRRRILEFGAVCNGGTGAKHG